ncbi:MAG: benzoate-CoA ligase family protein [Planctomycetota bacterium]|jgi:4-hydroxybenzoate-CoA ligase/benzoate-CoA ligase
MKAADIPSQYNAVEILEHNLPERAGKTALFSVEREATYGELGEEVNRVGNALKGLGVNFGDTIAILALDSVEWVTSYFGTIKIGARALSLSTLLTTRECEHMLTDSRARVLIASAALKASVEKLDRSRLPSLEHVIVIGETFEDWIANASPDLEAAATHRDDICCLNYSSGTTGEPKGIPHAHKDLPLTAHLWGRSVLGIREDDRTFAGAKLFFTFGTGGNLIFPFYAGASAVLLSGPPRVVDNVMGTVDRFKPTILYNAPTGYAATLATEGFQDKYDLSSLRICVSAGEALPAPLWRRWKEATGLDIIDGIGSTENYHIFLSNRPDDIRPGSSGKPFMGYDVRLVGEDGSEVRRGDVGNLWVRGETASLSYLHRYEESRRTFRGEWLVTGDKYYCDEDGYYWHAGRSDDMMKVGGIWVSPVEVESTLISHEAVVECAVVAERDSAELVKPLAFVVLKEGVEASEELAETLIAYCREEMADYKRPRRIEFVDELPKTATGKIQRFKLRTE